MKLSGLTVRLIRSFSSSSALCTLEMSQFVSNFTHFHYSFIFTLYLSIFTKVDQIKNENTYKYAHTKLKLMPKRYFLLFPPDRYFLKKKIPVDGTLRHPVRDCALTGFNPNCPPPTPMNAFFPQKIAGCGHANGTSINQGLYCASSITFQSDAFGLPQTLFGVCDRTLPLTKIFQPG